MSKSKPAFVLQWRTAAMPAPAFWYFATREAAEWAETRMDPARVVTAIRAVEVAESVTLEGA